MARVLVVDDDEDIRDLVSQSLENAGYDVAAAATGTEAWDALHAEHYDATVLDVCLPGLSGLDIARGLHDEHVLHPSDRTVVVMLSALSSSADARAGREAGADLYLTKPFRLHDLASHVRSLVATG